MITGMTVSKTLMSMMTMMANHVASIDTPSPAILLEVVGVNDGERCAVYVSTTST